MEVEGNVFMELAESEASYEQVVDDNIITTFQQFCEVRTYCLLLMFNTT